MSELDKYFEKARNVEPIYEKDDARKLLAGKLSDGGIATNLLNKIKVLPMIASIISSVALVATIALLQVSTSKKVVEPQKPINNKTEIVQSGDNIATETNIATPVVTHKESIATIVNNKKEQKEVTEKNDDNIAWKEAKIDVKAVNSLKLDSEQLAKLGITVGLNSFKVNAFDKYTYTINQNNEKVRDYYNKDEDHDALPTPAMITTSTGFKTLTLFKKGNVEAVVDRMRSISDDSTKKVYNINSYMNDFNQKDSDSAEVIKITKENIISLDTSFHDLHSFEESKNKEINHSTFDTIGENNYILNSKKPIKIFINNRNPNLKIVNKEKFKIVGNDTIYEKELYMVDMDNPTPLTEEELEKKRKAGMKTYHFPSTDIVTINNVTLQDSNIVEIKDSKQNNNKELEEKIYTEPASNLIIKDGESELNFKLRPGQKISGEEEPNGENKIFHSNMALDFINYNINELIPIEISFDGKKTDFIVWYEATDDFLKNLPPNILAKINPELAAISEQTDYCDNAPIEKNDAVMDVWSGCSGAIKNMRVFPNPATNSSKVEFNLEDSRKIWIAVYDLSGKLIKSLYKAVEYKKGNFDENLNLNGITSGMYYVLVKSDKGEQALQRIIIE